MRFPFTFIGFLALAIGLWVVVYVAVNRSLEPGSQALALVTAAACLGFGLYVLIRRVRRGAQH